MGFGKVFKGFGQGVSDTFEGLSGGIKGLGDLTQELPTILYIGLGISALYLVLEFRKQYD